MSSPTSEKSDLVTHSDPDETELRQLRSIILGHDNELVKEVLRNDARHLVTEVITEAIFDRQKQDASLNNVLQPLVEESVQKSVTHHSDKMVSSLYPLMGNLVRKYVTAFLADFLERTNQLIESSLTIKSIKWRLEAKRAGMGYAQYVAAQTFVYRVEHVFLIHGETGLLLNSVAHNNDLKSDADIISSMLTAINDFVGDSFLDTGDGEREQLQSVSTDNFNLLIKPGPKAIIVAAVIGNPPQQLSDQLQLTLEQIHSLYTDPLSDFEGDNTPFENTESQLRECLLSQQKATKRKQKRIPWYGLIIAFLFIIGLGYLSYLNYSSSQLTQQLTKLDKEPGIIVKQIDVPWPHEAKIEVMRDPSSTTIQNWLKQNQLNFEKLSIVEHPYVSRDSRLIKSTSASIENAKMTLVQARFQDLVNQISGTQLNFASNSAELNEDTQLTVELVAQKLKELLEIGVQIDRQFGLLIIGASDGSGNPQRNLRLSKRRAENVAKALLDQDLPKSILYTKGLGQIELETIKQSSRTVLFNVITTNRASTNQPK